MGRYRDLARKEARAIARPGLFKEIVAEILEKKGPTDKVHLRDYPNGDLCVPGDMTYSLWEGADVLEELDEFEETDAAYWEGKGVREALKIAASLTYRNAVHHYFTVIIDQINDLVGNMKIPWTFEDRYYMEIDPSGRGVLEWDPSIKKLEDFSDKERGRLEKKHQVLLSQEMQALIGESIKNA